NQISPISQIDGAPPPWEIWEIWLGQNSNCRSQVSDLRFGKPHGFTAKISDPDPSISRDRGVPAFSDVVCFRHRDDFCSGHAQSDARSAHPAAAAVGRFSNQTDPH